ncbi:MAG: peptidoglycan DD-metalloendopeptidase family protein [Alkalibacterium gilvum]|uniref:Murein DD-endopeptidase MepM and murein hydrolase activator NlpD, contain LysM domain n=1 Tax=Alkalibacterium gilvum TaxID=1130080 RepID=A0A1H6USV9_9LACT|nr:M23 family metallopeptidase [Alkalibacterium gilvum]SEI93754.1 Murein DD-endopeptidase MepM and murein hydrolase activator NlpD, contain LysM domain [Alkalibacterium gilvum]
MNKKMTISLITILMFAGSMLHLTEAEALENSEDSESKPLELLEEDVSQTQAKIDDYIIEITEDEENRDRIIDEIETYEQKITELEKQLEDYDAVILSDNQASQTDAESVSFIEIIMSTDSISNMFKELSDANELASTQRQVMFEQETTQSELKKAMENMEYEQEELAKIEAEIESGRADVISQRNELDDKIIQMTKEFEMSDEEQEELFTEKDSIMERTSHLDKEMEANKQRIFKEESEKNERLAKEKSEKEAKEKDTEKQKKDTQDANTSSVDTEGWIRPASGRISSSYGYRVHPVTGEKDSLHAGTDIAGGGAIVASRAGTVTSAEFSDTYGYSVIIDHGDGYSTLYAHMQANLSVAPGQSVSQGQQLGIMGTTGRSTGVHLHFEVRKDGATIDPMDFIK